MKLIRMAALALATTSMLTLAACTSSQQAAQEANTGVGSTGCPWEVDESITTEANIAYQIILSGDLVVKDHGILEACMPNAKINWTQYASTNDVVQALGSESADFGTMGSSGVVKALTAPLNLPVKVVWIQDVIGDAEALVVKDEALTDIAGLKGATIGVPFSSTTHFSLLAVLADAGLDPVADVTIVNLTPDAILSAWEGDQIDAAYIWDPTLAAIREKGKILVTSREVAASGAPTFDQTIVQTAFIEAEPAFMEVWTKAQDWAVTMFNENPEGAAESLSIEMSTPVADLLPQIAGTVYVSAAVQLSDYFEGNLASVMADTSAFLTEQAQIDAPKSTAEFQNTFFTGALTALN